MSYLLAAFNARPFDMAVPPNWFMLAAFGLLGGFVNPGFWLIGAGVEALYLYVLSRNQRFRRAVDAAARAGGRGSADEDWLARYEGLLGAIDVDAHRLQEEVEALAAETQALLRRNGAIETQIGGVRQLAWLHLKLLVARAAFSEVLDLPGAERAELDRRQAALEQRLAGADLDEELRRSLGQQLDVIVSRRAAHADAARRRELVDAELARVRQQLSLLREQALLASDESGVAQSLDALAASLNEADRWLRDQRDLLGDLDPLADGPPPEAMLTPKKTTKGRGRRLAGERQ